MSDPVAPAPIRLIPEMFQGHNKKALMSVVQSFAGKGIIIADLELEIERGSLRRTVIVTYCRESEGTMTKQFDPHGLVSKDNSREHTFPAHQFRIRTERGSSYLDPKMLISKLALLGSH